MRKADVAIVGAGPIGIELAVGLKRAGIDYVHLEAGPIGSTIHWYAPCTPFFSSPERIAIAGVPIVSLTQSKPTREEYVAYLRGVVEQFSLPIQTYTRVTRIERQPGEGFILRLCCSFHGVGGPQEALYQATEADRADQAEHRARTAQRAAESDPPVSPLGKGGGEKDMTATVGHCAIASGAASGAAVGAAAATLVSPKLAKKLVLAIGNLHLPRRLGIPGEDLPHVSHYFDDPHVYFGKRVLLVGGKNSAVEAAIRLVRVGCEVTLSYRRDQFNAKSVKYWLLPELAFFIKKGRMRFLPRTAPIAILPNAVQLASTDENGCVAVGEAETVGTDFVLLMTGYVQDQTLFEQAGVALEGDRRIPRYDSKTMETNVPGLYIAGIAAAGIHEGRALEFIETSHVHVDRIVASLASQPPPEEPPAKDPAFLES